MPRKRTNNGIDDGEFSEEALDRLVDRVLLAPDLRRASARIRREQRRLRALANAWAAYLLVEEITNERLDAALTVTVRAAYLAGLQAGCPS